MGKEPDSFPDLEFWLRSDILLVTGVDVDQMTDKSGNANHATGTGASRPTKVTGGLNGHDLVRFDGVTQFLTLGDILGSKLAGTSAKFSIFVFLKFNAVAAVQAILAKERGGTSEQGFIFFSFEVTSQARLNTLIRNKAGTLNIWERSTGDLGTTNAHVIAWVHDATQSTPVDRMTQYTDDISAAAVTTINNNETSFTDSTSPLLLGANRAFGIGDIQHMSVDLYEIFMYSHTSDSEEINDLMTYSRDRYNLIAINATKRRREFHREYNQSINELYN